MPLAEDQDMISVRGGGSDQALNIWILPGRRAVRSDGPESPSPAPDV
jgi:hypothetical protein